MQFYTYVVLTFIHSWYDNNHTPISYHTTSHNGIPSFLSLVPASWWLSCPTLWPWRLLVAMGLAKMSQGEWRPWHPTSDIVMDIGEMACNVSQCVKVICINMCICLYHLAFGHCECSCGLDQFASRCSLEGPRRSSQALRFGRWGSGEKVCHLPLDLQQVAQMLNDHLTDCQRISCNNPPRCKNKINQNQSKSKISHGICSGCFRTFIPGNGQGPVNWMAPELLRGQRPRQASDVHS